MTIFVINNTSFDNICQKKDERELLIWYVFCYNKFEIRKEVKK